MTSCWEFIGFELPSALLLKRVLKKIEKSFYDKDYHAITILLYKNGVVTYKRSIEHDVNMDYTEYHNQWCRSVVKYGARVSQVKPSNCFRRVEKIIFTFPF